MATPRRSVLITGCSDGGLGASLAVAFHNTGLQVYATARDPTKMKNLASLGIKTLTLDVLSASSIKQCVAQITHLDILVNNAGGMYTMPISDLSIAEAKNLFDLNVWSYISVTQAFLPLIVESKGLIVNQTSVLSVVTTPFAGAYNASKAAIAMLTDTMRLELEPFGVKVVDLKTGVVTSNLIQNSRQSGVTSLPADSIYTPVRGIVEKSMLGEEFEKTGMATSKWAMMVANELLKRNPSAQIWRGGNATLIWLSTYLPHGAFDGFMKKMAGIPAIKEKMKEKVL